MDNNNRPEYNDRERHNSIKKKLKIVGFICLIAGAVFTAIGLIDFFASIGGSDMPTKFWCAFVGLPLLGIGFAITSFAFRREISRYVKNESVPVINEAGKELTPAVRDIRFRRQGGIERQHEGGNPLFLRNLEQQRKQVLQGMRKELRFDLPSLRTGNSRGQRFLQPLRL